MKKVETTSAMPSKAPSTWSVLLGAAFIMATSAIGPGFLTQTAVFTEKYAANFAFTILAVIILDIGAQLNTWRIISMSRMRAQDIANRVFPGLGHFITILIAFGGLAFNIGNIAGCGMGFNVIFGMDVRLGAAISALIAIAIFISREMGKAMDTFAKILGVLMILLTLYAAVVTKPPVGEALVRSVAPTTIPFMPIITLLGGTVGGYIMFAGGHRLIDAGITGKENLYEVSKSAVTGIFIAGVMRIVLFLAALGVVAKGLKLDPANPPASVFQHAAGLIGYKIFGLVLWSAAITSVVGASYTTVSFLRSLAKAIDRRNREWIIGFILASTLIFVTVGKPVNLLILAGSLNGLILPITLFSLLLASRRQDLMGDYKHPWWLIGFGLVVVAIAAYASVVSFGDIAKLLK